MFRLPLPPPLLFLLPLLSLLPLPNSPPHLLPLPLNLPPLPTPRLQHPDRVVEVRKGGGGVERVNEEAGGRPDEEGLGGVGGEEKGGGGVRVGGGGAVQLRVVE